MLKPLGNSTPSVYLFFWKCINIIGYFLVRNQHQMHLQIATAIAFLSEILQHFCVADRSIRNIRFKEFTEFIIDNVDSSKSTCLQAFSNTFIKVNNIKAKERIEQATRCKHRVGFFKVLISHDIIVGQFIDEHLNRLVYHFLELAVGVRKFIFPSPDNLDGSFIVGFR